MLRCEGIGHQPNSARSEGRASVSAVYNEKNFLEIFFYGLFTETDSHYFILSKLCCSKIETKFKHNWKIEARKIFFHFEINLKEHLGPN